MVPKIFLVVVPTIILLVILTKVVRSARRRRDAKGERVLRGASVDNEFAAKEETGQGGDGLPEVQIGGVAVPYSVEAQHLLFAGTTGSGKTQGINQVLKVIRARGKRAMVADAGGESLARFFRAGDEIFNPLDQRSVQWSPFAEIREEYDCARLARAAIPDGEGESREWHHYAQTLLGETMLAMHKAGLRSVAKLLYFLTSADAKELAQLLAGTPAAILCQGDSEKMLGSTRAIIATFVGSWRYLPDEGTYSVRDWVRNDAGSNWLFVVYRDDQAALTRSLVATVLELGLVEALSMPEDPDRDLWFVMDEVDSLGKIASLRDALSKLRKHGCKCVLGLQTVAQLTSTYGAAEAQTLMANVATKLVLRAGDGETAEYFSKEFGDQEVIRPQISKSKGSPSPTVTTTMMAQEIKRAVLGSEISSLPNLDGFLKTPPGRLRRIRLIFEQFPSPTEAFVGRSEATPPLRALVNSR